MTAVKPHRQGAAQDTVTLTERMMYMTPNILTADKTGLHANDIFSAAFADERKIYLDTEINAHTASELIAQLEYLDKKSHADITICINSPGGVVSAGLAVIDAMNRCKSDVVTVCTGIAASMASVICACGAKGKRYITPYAEIMIHQPLGGVSGQASDIELAASHISDTKKLLMHILSEKTGQSVKRITADCDRDSYMNAEKAVSYGLVDAILK